MPLPLNSAEKRARKQRYYQTAVKKKRKKREHCERNRRYRARKKEIDGMAPLEDQKPAALPPALPPPINGIQPLAFVSPRNVDLVLPTNNKKTPYGAVEVRKPTTPEFEVRIRKRIAKELKPSKRKIHSQDTVASLLAVQDKLTTKDASFSRKLSDYVDATEEDDEEEENSEDVLHYLRMVNLVVVISLVYIALFVWSPL
jgi:hypothetical protein